MTLPRRLPIPAAPARHETVASYLHRLATLHGLTPRDMHDAVRIEEPRGTAQAVSHNGVDLEALSAVTGRPVEHLAQALPELRDPPPDWVAWRHQAQPRCPRCDARHLGWPVLRLLPHHRYVCTRHRYWIGPPDAGQSATELHEALAVELIRAQHQHMQLVRGRGAAAAFDAVLTGFLICGHLWDQQRHAHLERAVQRWDERAAVLIPHGREQIKFGASRLFAAVYPEAVALADLFTDPIARAAAGGSQDQQEAVLVEARRRLAAGLVAGPGRDALLHWMRHDAHHPPSRPTQIYPHNRSHFGRPGGTRSAPLASLERQARSAIWFASTRRGGGAILHHRHLRPVIIRDWSPPMDGINAAIWATTTTERPNRTSARAETGRTEHRAFA